MMEEFRAGVQYNDYVGTVAADRHDNNDLLSYLRQRDLIPEGEVLVGVQVSSGAVHGPSLEWPFSVKAILAKGANYDSVQAEADKVDALVVREVDLNMSLQELFGLFKRFEICMSLHGIIDGKTVRVTD